MISDELRAQWAKEQQAKLADIMQVLSDMAKCLEEMKYDRNEHWTRALMGRGDDLRQRAMSLAKDLRGWRKVKRGRKNVVHTDQGGS